ncbi:MAG: hypothetical protein O6945_16395 [Gammaproteobacteria bacterium]|nr:hypothetical protein [Gammaproteobacteria bacterium]
MFSLETPHISGAKLDTPKADGFVTDENASRLASSQALTGSSWVPFNLDIFLYLGYQGAVFLHGFDIGLQAVF